MDFRKNNFCLLKDKVLDYIDENFCSNLNGKIKENCKTMIESNGNDLINEIKQGKVRIKIFILINYMKIFSNRC